MTASSSPSRIRIDKWLWYARQAKTRSLAQKLVTGGKVRINSEKTGSANKLVGPDDVITLTLPRAVKVLKIMQCGEKRGPFSQARLLYEDLSPPIPQKREKETDGKPLKGKRPDKRERRHAQILSGRRSEHPD